jgi:hypothetical protein
VEYFDSDLIAYGKRKKPIYEPTSIYHTGKNFYKQYAAHKPSPRAAQGNSTAGNVRCRGSGLIAQPAIRKEAQGELSQQSP